MRLLGHQLLLVGLRFCDVGSWDGADVDVRVQVPDRHWLDVAIGVDRCLPVTRVIIEITVTIHGLFLVNFLLPICVVSILSEEYMKILYNSSEWTRVTAMRVRTYIAVMVFFVREISEHASLVSEA